jgi:hypothetical protein
MKLGEVISIQIATNSDTKLESVLQMGLEGGRYYNRTGTYSDQHDESREATLIESEALEALARDYQIEIRAQIITSGIVRVGDSIESLPA